MSLGRIPDAKWTGGGGLVGIKAEQGGEVKASEANDAARSTAKIEIGGPRCRGSTDRGIGGRA